MSAPSPAQRAITTAFSRTIWKPVRRALREYALLQPGDRIAVCISGGKDSLLLACALNLLHQVSDVPFSLVGLSMDPGYTPESRAQIERNLQALGIETHWYRTRLFETVNRETDNPCFLCARLRRGSLYETALSLGCNKIALGHHFDDVVETTLLSMLYGGQVQTMLPKLRAKNYPGMQVIRPLYLVRERDILAWREACGLTCLACSCEFAGRARRAGDPASSKRYEIKQLIARLERDNDQVAKNIFNSVKNVNVDDVLGWHQGAQRHSFLDGYDDA
ncbi:MAG TPA: tRNA 2-thiocytidine biosynthesis protein TtcA [Candidatus Butyricicoccus stercorigallinarum]|nr:tRNA 2-thiocytidine biosynthesis protein TtcA [Candidatus Butyricicoccus stercorigallinarum]